MNENSDVSAGLFGTLSGTVQNLLLVNPVVAGGDCVGALAGEIASDDAHVSRCGVIGAAVTASGNCAGAFAGQIGGGAVVSECFASGTVASGGNSAGGLVGNAIVTSTNLADKAWLAIRDSRPWTANTAGEAGWIPVSNLGTTDPVRFWRIGATLYSLEVGDSVEFTEP